jgi:hypothetical protein
MTEEEWLACKDPEPMLEFVWNNGLGRKFRLFGCAVCRRVWKRMHDRRCRTAVEASEQFADGLISESELDTISNDAEQAYAFAFEVGGPDNEISIRAARVASFTSRPSLHLELWFALVVEAAEIGLSVLKDEFAAQADLVREIVGNPFHPVTFSPEWQTDTALSLARQMYDNRDFSAMPILADALQDAGCDNEDILAHCRDPKATHVRGCWVVDLLLGKE